MNRIEEQILEEYAENYCIESKSYELMGKMLDIEFLRERCKLFDIFDTYIYGGTYLAAQLCYMMKNEINILGIVDKAGKVLIQSDIKVLDLSDLMEHYNGEKIIVTPIRYYMQIKEDLIRFADEKNIIFVGELLEGLI